jgi:hypothetical protein
MGIDGGVACGTSQFLVLPVWDMQVGLGVAVLLGQAEIDHVDLQGSSLDGIIAESRHRVPDYRALQSL